MAKKTPFKINESLVKRTRLTSNYTGGESSTMGEWNVDNMFESSKQTMADRMINNENENLSKQNRAPKYSRVGGDDLTELQKKQSKLDEILEKRTAKYGEDSDEIENWRTKRLRKQIADLQDIYDPQNLNKELYTSEFNQDIELPTFRGGNIVANNDNQAYVKFKGTGKIHNDGSEIVQVVNSRGDVIDELSKQQIVQQYPNLVRRKGNKYYPKGWETRDDRTRNLKRNPNSNKSNNSPLEQREQGEEITPQNPLPIGPPYSDSYLESRGMRPEDYKNAVSTQGKFFDTEEYSPMRDNYLPNKGRFVKINGQKFWQASDGSLHTGQVEDYERELQQDKEMFPDGPPLKQLEQPMEGGMLPEITIYDTFNTISDEELNKKKQDYIENFNFGVESSSRMDVLGNPKWKETVRVWLKKAQENMFNAIGDGQTDIAAKWMDNAVNLVNNNVKVFENKKVNDWARQYSDEIKGNTGGSIMSKGSHKGDMRKMDLTYMGAENVALEISEDGNFYFKMEGIDDVWTVNDLGRNTFPKNFNGAVMWDDFKKQLIRAAKEGSPISKSSIKSTIDNLLQNEASVLSFAHDNLSTTQSMFEMYEEEARRRNIAINPNPFMPESKEFDIKRVKNMVKKGLEAMAEETYSSHIPKQAKDLVEKASKNLSAKELIEKYK